MSHPLVSIISPVYNHEAYIAAGIQSIIDQSYKNIELIILNDGSTDNSTTAIQAILDKCEIRFERVVFRDRENQGVIRTLNEGLSLAQGEYVATLPSDDAHFPDSIETMVNFLETHEKFVLAVGDNQLIDDDGNVCYWNKKRINIYDKTKAKYASFADYLRKTRYDVDFKGEDFGNYSSLLKGNYIPNGYLMRKSALDSVGGYNEKSPIEDHHLMLSLAKLGKMKYFDRELYQYRWHEYNMIKGMKDLGAKVRANLVLEKDYCQSHKEYLPIWEEQMNAAQTTSPAGKVIKRLKRSIKKRMKW